MGSILFIIDQLYIKVLFQIHLPIHGRGLVYGVRYPLKKVIRETEK